MDHLTTILIQEALRRQANFTSYAAEDITTRGFSHYGAVYTAAGQLLAQMGDTWDRPRLEHFVGTMLDTLGTILQRNIITSTENIAMVGARIPNPLKPLVPPPLPVPALPALPAPPAPEVRLKPAGFLSRGKKYTIEE